MILQVTKCEHGVDLTERECRLCSQRTVTVSTPCERCKELETKLNSRDEEIEQKDVRLLGLIRERDQALSRLGAYLKAFKHYHVAQEGTDICAQCGFDLRNEIHRRVGDADSSTAKHKPGCPTVGCAMPAGHEEPCFIDRAGEAQGTNSDTCVHWVGHVRQDVTHAMCLKCGEMIAL